MRWRLEDRLSGSKFYHAAGVHYGDAVRDLGDYGEIVRDEEHGQAELGAKFSEQVEDLGLDGDIERGGGLVGDEQLRAIHDGHRDHDALAHAAGELVRIVAGAADGLGDGDVGHGLDGEASGFVFRARAVSQNGFGDL